MIDYNLYGMNWVDFRSVIFRKSNIAGGQSPDSQCDMMTNCQLEGDALDTDIINREGLKGVQTNDADLEGPFLLHVDVGQAVSPGGIAKHLRHLRVSTLYISSPRSSCPTRSAICCISFPTSRRQCCFSRPFSTPSLASGLASTSGEWTNS